MNNYSFIQKFLHDIVLKNKFVNKSLFEIEKLIFLKNKEIKNQKHIFITGLPRSGTTSLLNFLYSSNEYASLTYKNMPFILSPNLSNFINQKNLPKKERAHKDGIIYDINSPEALDEIFFSNKEYYIKNEIENYLKIILISKNKKKYLSKNNLNYKRIELIQSILPNSIFLIPIREPLQHSFSLLNQHFNFTELQKKDDFIRRYMNYLGHNEFGLNHKPWNKPINYQDFNQIDYWLEQWILFYQNIFNKYQNLNYCLFISYEKLIDSNYVKKIITNINLNNSSSMNLSFFKHFKKGLANLNFNNNNYIKAKNLYNKFL